MFPRSRGPEPAAFVVRGGRGFIENPRHIQGLVTGGALLETSSAVFGTAPVAETVVPDGNDHPCFRVDS